jgi:hypothetical protein
VKEGAAAAGGTGGATATAPDVTSSAASRNAAGASAAGTAAAATVTPGGITTHTSTFPTTEAECCSTATPTAVRQKMAVSSEQAVKQQLYQPEGTKGTSSACGGGWSTTGII